MVLYLLEDFYLCHNSTKCFYKKADFLEFLLNLSFHKAAPLSEFQFECRTDQS